MLQMYHGDWGGGGGGGGGSSAELGHAVTAGSFCILFSVWICMCVCISFCMRLTFSEMAVCVCVGLRVFLCVRMYDRSKFIQNCI